MKNKIKELKVWIDLVEKFNINEEIQEKIINYIDFLLHENKKYDLTGITDLDKIVTHHLLDSFNVSILDSFKNADKIVDVGTGCGVPGLVLAIGFPEKNFILIEVMQKRINFLKETIKALNIKNVTLYENDFKTFVRKNEEYIDIFFSRATLNLKDLIFIYSTEAGYIRKQYKNSRIIYWGSEKWQENLKNKITNKMIKLKENFYKIDEKTRIYVEVNI